MEDDGGPGGRASPWTAASTTEELILTINSLLIDHFERAGLQRTKESFLADCRSVGLPLPRRTDATPMPRPGGVSERTMLELLSAFDHCYEDAFFERWKVVPHVDVLQSYPTKVAFRMAVYFNCRRIVEGLSSVPESLANIRARLDRSGPTLSSDPDLIAYFALPFVRNPKAHPTFRHLFHPDGWARLRKDLIGYLLSLRFSGAFASPLGRLVAQGGHAGATEEDHPPPSSETDSEELRRSLAEVTRKHQTLRRDYQKLMAVTKELTNGLEMAAKDQMSGKDDRGGGHQGAPSWTSVILDCSKAHPEVFRPAAAATADPEPNDNDNDLEPPAAQEPSVSSTVQRAFPVQELVGRLDLRKIKVDLGRQDDGDSGHDRRRAFLLQSLRWLITKMEDNHLKRAVMVRYLKSDLLAVNNDEDEDEDEEEGACQAFLRRVSEATPSGGGAGLRTAHYGDFAESLVRLLNVLASIKMGRDYLGNSKAMVQALISGLVQMDPGKVEPGNQAFVSMAVAVLQKLSLRKYLRWQMIRLGVLEWLAGYLDNWQAWTGHHDHHQADPATHEQHPKGPCPPLYLLEYSTALFMNLCLHKSGKQRCLPVADIVLRTFCGLLSLHIKQILPYVFGTLYNLLGDGGQMRAKAKEFGVRGALERVFDGARGLWDEEACRQLTCLIRCLDHLPEETAALTDDGYQGGEEDDGVGGEEVDDGVEEQGEEDDEDDDEEVVIESEVDLDDVLVPEGPEELAGQLLLQTEYLLQDTADQDCSGGGGGKGDDEGVGTGSSSSNSSNSPVKDLDLDLEGSAAPIGRDLREASPPTCCRVGGGGDDDGGDDALGHGGDVESKEDDDDVNDDLAAGAVLAKQPEMFEIRNSPPLPALRSRKVPSSKVHQPDRLEQTDGKPEGAPRVAAAANNASLKAIQKRHPENPEVIAKQGAVVRKTEDPKARKRLSPVKPRQRPRCEDRALTESAHNRWWGPDGASAGPLRGGGHCLQQRPLPRQRHHGGPPPVTPSVVGEGQTPAASAAPRVHPAAPTGDHQPPGGVQQPDHPLMAMVQAAMPLLPPLQPPPSLGPEANGLFARLKGAKSLGALNTLLASADEYVDDNVDDSVRPHPDVFFDGLEGWRQGGLRRPRRNRLDDVDIRPNSSGPSSTSLDLWLAQSSPPPMPPPSPRKRWKKLNPIKSAAVVSEKSSSPHPSSLLLENDPG